MNHLEYNQFLADNAGNPEAIFQDLETTNALHIKAEKIFGICFELEDGEFNDEIYLKVGKVINDFRFLNLNQRFLLMALSQFEH